MKFGSTGNSAAWSNLQVTEFNSKDCDDWLGKHSRLNCVNLFQSPLKTGLHSLAELYTVCMSKLYHMLIM